MEPLKELKQVVRCAKQFMYNAGGLVVGISGYNELWEAIRDLDKAISRKDTDIWGYDANGCPIERSSEL